VNLARLFPHAAPVPPIGRPWEPSALPSHGGVLAITDADRRVFQLLRSQNIRRTVLARLRDGALPAEGRRTDVRAIAHEILWSPAYSQFEAMWVYWNTARQLWPRDYFARLEFGLPWFAAIRLDARFPRWLPRLRAFVPGVREVGPFDSRRKCAQYIAVLEEMFDLCRYHDVLTKAPHGQACAYFEMGKCPAPCDGTISLDVYRHMLAASADFAQGRQSHPLRTLEEKMRGAAESRDFVAAAKWKELLERCQGTLRRARPITSTPAEFRYLVVQRGETRSRVKPFFVTGGSIDAGPSETLRSLPQSANRWIARMADAPNPKDSQVAHHIEVIGLVVHFLAKGPKAPGLYIRFDQLPTPDKLRDLIREAFAPAARRAAPDNVS